MLGDQRRVARPEPDVVANAAEMDRQRRAPAARAEHRNSRAHARAPRRRSVPARCATDSTGAETRSAPRRCTRDTTMMTGLPVAYAIAGSVSDASTEPSETYLVIHTPTKKIASAGRQRDRRQDGEDSASGRHAFAATEPKPRRIDMTDDGGQTSECRRGWVVAETLRQQNADGTLRDVERGDEHAGSDAGGAKDVGGAKVAAAGPSQVRSPRPREEQRKWNRPDGVGGKEDGGHAAIVRAEPQARRTMPDTRRCRWPLGVRGGSRTTSRDRRGHARPSVHCPFRVSNAVPVAGDAPARERDMRMKRSALERNPCALQSFSDRPLNGDGFARARRRSYPEHTRRACRWEYAKTTEG